MAGVVVYAKLAPPAGRAAVDEHWERLSEIKKRAARWRPALQPGSP
jgi:hypothetical protein